jgi:hypothetical protein
MTQVDVVKLLGLKSEKSGKPSKQRLNRYLTDSPSVPDANVLYLACTKLEGFNFEHNGYRLARPQVVDFAVELHLKGFLRTFGAGESAYHLLRTGG